MNDLKIQQIKKLIYDNIVLESESNCTTEFRTIVEKTIFEIENVIEVKNKCGKCGRINPHYNSKIHSSEIEPLFCNSKCAKEYYE